ncbi:glucosaminidase domain-containing protein [Ochrovirga pacifica]|uniref:glucosaminidase domain-containing protein n=1 Tax=Ochrovirga pacifica TaxID=1042376 RepID=UPI000255A7DB|nr:glucosaminidase domain-containing protein [Ochrovirga pacifica]
MKKIFVIVAIGLLASCGSSKKVAKTTPKQNIPADTEVKVTPTRETVKEVKKVIKDTQKNTKSYLSQKTLDYIEEFAPLAMEEMQTYKIPASITLAQGILESGSGTSTLASKSNNHFGIKCHRGWTGKRVYHDDDQKGECFRKYEYAATSYRDHSTFLVTRSRYLSLFRLREDDYKGWAKGLKKAGYATDPKYPQKLVTYIEKYNLDAYDAIVLKGKVKTVAVVEETSQPTKVVTTNTTKVNKAVLPINGMHIVGKDDTLYSISRTYGVSIDELKKWNDLDDNIIHKNQVLKLRKKRNQNQVYIVKKKDTLYSIAKKFGLTVLELKQINDLQNNDLSIGQELRIN